MLETAQVWVRDPDGNFLNARLSKEKDNPVIRIPENLSLNGRYMAIAYLNTGKADIDGDGTVERIHLHAKYFVLHTGGNGKDGCKPAVFSHAPDKIGLEIVPVVLNPGHIFSGMGQRPHHEYEMQVFYRGNPVENVDVTVFTDSGWQKNSEPIHRAYSR